MPPRRNTRKRKATDDPAEVEKAMTKPGVDATPPLPDEPVPNSNTAQDDDAPPLPDEPVPDQSSAPPLPDEPVPELSSGPPLPDEPLPSEPPSGPPLPDEPVPSEPVNSAIPEETQQTASESESSKMIPESKDDGWIAILDPASQKYYFHNRLTNETTWTNPRSSDETEATDTTTATNDTTTSDPSNLTFQARFDKRTGRFISDPNRTVENYTPEARAARQMSHFFDPTKLDDSGVSLKAERRALKHSKEELRVFKQRQKERKEQKRREWLIKD